jgi:hypothetical protein
MTDTAARWERDQARAAELQQQYGDSTHEPPKTITVKDDDGNDIEVVALDFARIRLWLPTLERLIQYGLEEPIYYLELTDRRRIKVGTVTQLRRTPDATLDAIAVEMGDAPTIPLKKWHPIFRALLAIRKIEDTGTTPGQETAGWIASFLEESLRPGAFDLSVQADSTDAATNDHHAFTDTEGHLHLRVEELDRYIRTVLRVSRGEVSKGALCARLRGLGFKYTNVYPPRDEAGNRPERRYWRSPAGFNPKADQ